MKDGSVIVDLAAEQGGNCALTKVGQVVRRHGVTIVGYTDLPSRLPTQSSQLYATNLRHLIDELTPEKDGAPHVNMDDEVIRCMTVVKDGEITWPPPTPRVALQPRAMVTEGPHPRKHEDDHKPPHLGKVLAFMGVFALCLLGLGSVAPAAFLSHLTVFALACFVGYMVVWNVTPSLHTPLMSVTNAISGIIVIGALLEVSDSDLLIKTLAGVALFISTINIAGGFLVTHRMLKMFQR